MIRACVLLALAACASAGYAGYPYSYTLGTPGVTTYGAPLTTFGHVASVPTYGYYGYGYPGYGFGPYGLSYGYGYGLGGLGYPVIGKK
ncbi:uncharacterized protein LOC144121413 [Amblyomma americanum]